MYSKIYKVNGGSKFRYNYESCVLEFIMVTKGVVEVLDASGLDTDEWKDNPEHWVDQYNHEIEEELHYLMQGL